MAIAERWLAKHFNRPDFKVFDYDVYAMCGDGDMMEGVTSEAASLAGHLMLGNLCWIYDSNRITIEGHTDLAFSDDVAARFLAYGWNVKRVGDANDTERLSEAIEEFRSTNDVPTLIIVESHIGYGAPHKQDTSAAHGEPLGVEEIRLAKRSYGWPEDAKFLVPDGVREHFSAGIGQRGGDARATWSELFEKYRAKHSDLADEIDRMQRRELPEGWDGTIPRFPADPKGVASRDASGKVLNAIAQHIPWLIGGAADLSPSTKTNLTFELAGKFENGSYGGRNLHFGIREHAMGAAVNGLALSKLRAYGSTFLIFSDYMKPTIRLSALMQLPTVTIFTHDSIGLGQDGPTHQPVEQLIALRAIPGLITLRPADANEVAEAWRVIVGLKHQPACLVLSRQPLPTFDRERYASAAGVACGAYVMVDAENGKPEVILIGTGSEVALCVEAYETLKAERHRGPCGQHAVVGIVRAAGSSLPREGVAACRYGPRVGRGRLGHRLGSLCRHGWCQNWHAYVRIVGTDQGCDGKVRFHPGKSSRRGQKSDYETPDSDTMNPLKQLEACGQSPWLDYPQA